VRDRAGPALAGAIVLGAAVLAGAAVARRRPALVVPAIVATLPFRVPLTIGSTTANLLLPLYAVVAAATVAHVTAVLRDGGEDGAVVGRDGPAGLGGAAVLLPRALAAFVVLYALQATYAGDPSPAVQDLAFFLAPFALLFALLAGAAWTARLMRTCLLVLVGLALAFCLVAFGEVLVRDVLWNDKLIASNTYNPYLRVNSLFYDPNVLGRFLAVTAVLVAAWVAGRTRRSDLLSGAAVLGVLCLGMLSTLSQSSFGALLVGLGVLTAIRTRPRLVVAVAVGLALAGTAVVAAAPGAVGLGGPGDSFNEATSGRGDLLGGGVDLFRARPVAGYGSGTFEDEYRRLRGATAADELSASHTTPVTVAAEQGTVGLLAYAALLVVALATLLPGARGSAARAAVAAAFAALLFHTFVYAAFLEDPLTWALLAAGVALASAAAVRQTSSRAASTSPTSMNRL
jgi:putative inorganic carbon (HCO3(-)) transporter